MQQRSAPVEVTTTFTPRSGSTLDAHVRATSGDRSIDFGHADLVQFTARFESQEGDSLRYLAWLPAHRFDTSRVALLIPAWGAPVVSLHPLALELVRRGMPVVMVSYRGFGLNEELARTYGLQEIDDVEEVIGAYAAVMNQQGIDVRLFGTSLGGAIALNVAAEDNRVGRVVLEGLMPDADAAARLLMSPADVAARHSLQQSYLDAGAMQPSAALGRLPKREVMLVWGGNDDITRADGRRALESLARRQASDVKVLEVTGGEHTLRYGIPLTAEEAVRINADIAGFLAR